MYNEEQKKRYIEYKESRTVSADGIIRRLFDAIEPYEIKYGKDCCEFTEEEVLNFYKMLNTRSVDSIINHNSRLSLYVDWCLTQGLVKDGQNHYRTLKQQNFETCINSMAIHVLHFTREEWLNSISVLINPRDQFLMLYLFEVGAKDLANNITNMTMDWFEGNTLHLPDRDVIVSNELVSYAEKADQELYLYNYNDQKQRRLEAEETGKIFKWKKIANGAVVKQYTTLNGLMLRLFKILDCPTLRPKEVGIMGQVYMLNTIARKEGKTIEDVIMNPVDFNKVKKQYGITMSSSIYIRRFKGYLT